MDVVSATGAQDLERQPEEVRFSEQIESAVESDADSLVSRGNSRSARKRKKTKPSPNTPSDEAGRLSPEDKRKRKEMPPPQPLLPPPTPSISAYVRASKAQKVLLAGSTEKEAESSRRVLRSARSLDNIHDSSPCSEDPKQLMAKDMSAQIDVALDSISHVARVSKNLSGRMVKQLKDAVQCIRELSEELLERTSSEEVRKMSRKLEFLQRENSEIKSELEMLRREYALGKEALASAQPVASQSREEVRSLKEQEATFNARLCALERIMLRPNLAGGKSLKTFSEVVTASLPKSSASLSRPGPLSSNKASASYSNQASSKSSSPPDTAPMNKGAEEGNLRLTRRRKKKKKKSVVPPAGAQQQIPPTGINKKSRNGTGVPPLPTQPSRGGDQWETAGKRKAERKAAQKKRKAAKKAAARLSVPRSAAVVLTLQPEAVEQGVSYAELLSKAKASVKLDELDINGLRFKTTRTGARLLEIPGAASGSKADALADKLMASLPKDVVRVSRPIKTIELRVSGLDDSVSQAELTAAVAKVGNCPAEQVRASTIRPAPSGLRTAVISCPVAAAKKLAGGKRLLVGWVSAQVKILPPRPLRCYRCMTNGHVGVRCTAEVTCVGRCFRCGQSGHKAADCSAAPHCAACAATGKPADHRMGSKACAPPKNKGNKTVTAVTIKPSVPSAPPAAPVEMEVVELTQ